MSFAYMALFTGDYLRDTRHLTPEEHGCYLLLLMHCWDQKGPVPLDERKQAGIVNARSGGEIESLRRVLAEFFVRMDDGYYNQRMTEEIAKSEKLSAARRKGGLEKARKHRDLVRAAKHCAQAVHEQNSSMLKQVSPSPSPSSPPSSPLPPSPTPSGKSNPSPAAARKTRASPAAKGSATWQAYATAYFLRYGVEPIRNATVNAALSRLVDRLGEEAPAVAAYYVSHNRQLYVAAKHSVVLLLRDAEGIRTDWATAHQTTEQEARQADRVAGQGQVWDKLIKEAMNAKS